ncbi:MAG: hypothetical protein ACYCZQ_13905 [Burkholderiales bacterium]
MFRRYPQALLFIVSIFILAACDQVDKNSVSAAHRNGGTSTSPAADDVAGLKIGMSPQDARSQIVKINPRLKITERHDNGWNALVIRADEPGEIIALKFTETDPKLWFIGRAVAFPKGQRPTRKNLQDELIAKYGTPNASNDWMKINSLVWEWKADGSPEDNNPYTPSVCGAGSIMADSWSGTPGAPIITQESLPKECGKRISAVITGEPGELPDIAAGISLTITDIALALRDPKHPYNVSVSQERKQIEEAQKYRPKL